ncbi:MAG: SurA N-terminal domain-containing protein [Desulfobacterales bacterium]|nr:SurA N-terminal domain-containing protein [Desulfobacterales bacterium]
MYDQIIKAIFIFFGCKRALTRQIGLRLSISQNTRFRTNFYTKGDPMLNLMRKYATSWMIKFVLGAIVVVFVFWGVGSFRSQKANRVALVNGEAITVEEYRETYNNIIEQLRQQFGNNLNDGLIEMLQVDKQAIDQLIDQRLIMREAKRLNFSVTNTELSDSIQKIKAFQSAGIFDNSLYKRVLLRNRLTPEEFEVLQRKSMLLERVKAFVEDGVKVSDAEALEWYNWKNTAINIDFVLFKSDRYQNIKVADSEIQSYFEKNKESYKTEPKVKVRYIEFNSKAYESQVKITEEEVAAYFDEHSQEFNKPKTVAARHILFAVEQDADPQAVEAAKQKAQKVWDMAKSGKDFAELAKQYSEGPTKDAGGYLGTFKKEDMIKPFADRAFAMKSGDISEPVRTQFGWHIIKVEKVNEAGAPSFSTARPEIVKKLTAERAKTMAYDDAESTYELTFEANDLAKAALAQNLSVQTTDFFSLQGPQKEINEKSKFASVAFSLSEMEISDVQNLGDDYYIIQLLEKISERVPELSAVSEKVKTDLTQERQKEKASQEANGLLTALKSGKALKDETKLYGLQVNNTGFFKRNEQIPKIGYEPEIMNAAFTLSAEKKLPDTVVAGVNGFYVIVFKERKGPDPAGYEKEKEQIVSNLLGQKQLRAFTDWLAQLRANSEIQLEKNL